MKLFHFLFAAISAARSYQCIRENKNCTGGKIMRRKTCSVFTFFFFFHFSLIWPNISFIFFSDNIIYRIGPENSFIFKSKFLDWMVCFNPSSSFVWHTYDVQMNECVCSCILLLQSSGFYIILISYLFLVILSIRPQNARKQIHKRNSWFSVASNEITNDDDRSNRENPWDGILMVFNSHAFYYNQFIM